MNVAARLAVALAFLTICVPASAVTISPTPGAGDTINAGDNACSLREAIIAANTNTISGGGLQECPAGSPTTTDTIMLAAGLYKLTIAGPSEELSATGDLDISQSVDFVGAGSGQTTIDADHLDRVLDIHAGSVSITGAKITNGSAPAGAAGSPGGTGQDGGGIRSAGGALSLTDVDLTANAAGNGGNGTVAGSTGAAGGLGGRGGGIYATSSVTLTNSTVSSNNGGNGGNGGSPGPMGGTGFGGGGGSGGAGGGIWSQTGTLTISDSTLSGNHAGNGGAGGGGDFGASGGQAAPGGGIENNGPLVIDKSVVTGNSSGNGINPGFGTTISGMGSSGGTGGGIDQIASTATITDSDLTDNHTGAGGAGGIGAGSFGGQGGYGGALSMANNALVTIATTNVSGNTTGAGGSAPAGFGSAGGSGAGIQVVQGTLTFTDGTISGNTTGSGGPGSPGGAGGFGAGIYNTGGTVNVTNATISANTNGATGGGGPGGGGAGGGGVYHVGGNTTNLVNTTIAGNAAAAGGSGGGIAVSGNGLTLTNSVVANNSAVNCFVQGGSIADGGHNVSYPDATCPGTNADPKLGALGNNGGRTKTMALGDGSAAIDIVPATGASCPAADQRGKTRPQASACDSGAFEADAPVPAPPAEQPPAEQPPATGGETPPPPAPATVAADKTAPLVKLLLAKQKLLKTLQKGYVGAFSTNEPGSASLELFAVGKEAKGTAAKSKRVAIGRLTITKAGKQRLIAKFTRKAKKAFAKRKRVTLTLVLTVRDAAGNATRKTVKVVLKR